MSSHVRVWDLLQAIRSKLGSDARRQIALAIKVDPRTVDYWFQDGPRAKIRDTNLDALARFAISLGIDTRQFEAGAPLWCPELTFGDQVQYDPGPHPEHLGFKRDHLRHFGRDFDACFGSAAGPIAQSPLQMYHLAKTGCAFVTTRTFLPYYRKPNPPPPILRYVSEIEDSNASKENCLPTIVFEDFEPVSRPGNGIGTNTGYPSPGPDRWVQTVVDARRMFSEDPDTDSVVLIVSVAGFAGEKGFERSKILMGYEDAVRIAVSEAQAEIVEVNVGSPSMVRRLAGDPELLREIALCTRKAVGNQKLILKIGASHNIEQIVLQIGPIVDGIASVNSIRVDGIRLDQENAPHQAWVSGDHGLAGAPILRRAADACKRIVDLRDKKQEIQHLTLIGIGGVTRPEDIVLYREKIGVELVAGFTAFLEDSLFAIRARRFLDTRQAVDVRSASKRREMAAYNWALALESEMQEVHPTDRRRLGDAASAVYVDYLERLARVNRVAIARRPSITVTIDEFRRLIAKEFKGRGGGGNE